MIPGGWFLMGLLVILGGAGIRRLLRARTGRQPFLIDDEAIRRIREEGYLAVEDRQPLDLKEIKDAEEEFWRREPWEDPEEY